MSSQLPPGECSWQTAGQALAPCQVAGVSLMATPPPLLLSPKIGVHYCVGLHPPMCHPLPLPLLLLFLLLLPLPQDNTPHALLPALITTLGPCQPCPLAYPGQSFSMISSKGELPKFFCEQHSHVLQPR